MVAEANKWYNIFMNPNTPSSSPEFEQYGSVNFGDNGELVLDSFLEEVGDDGVVAAHLFYTDKNSGRQWAVEISREQPELDESEYGDEPADTDTLPPGLIVENVDPKAVIDVLRLPTQELLQVSQPADTEEDV